MIDREFSVRDYEQGFRDGKHEANAEIARLRAALLDREVAVASYCERIVRLQKALEGK